ncbi:MAG: hypothetical protein DRQ55_04190 [Planctomycetota bacterium]|nr:MAG: hypothetical protein DRQ55_04190 [Planctomycetota bacterium]
MSGPADRAWTWREAGPDDYAEQARLFNTCFGKQKSVDTFRWKYAQNPHGPALSRVACDAGGHVVGGYSYVPRRFLRDGEAILLYQASDAMVDPSARRQRIFTGLDDIACEAAGEQGADWAYAYSGRLSFNGFLRNGWSCIGYAQVLRYRFRSRRGLARCGRLAPLAQQLAPLLDASYRLRDRRLAAHGAAAAALTPVQRFDASFDELFQASAPRTGLVGVRDHAWLNWRYIDTPSRRQQCWALREPGGVGLRGWLVTECVDGNAYLVDHLARDEDARATLMAAFTSLAHAHGLHEATAMLCSHHPATPRLLELGWRAPRGRRPFRDVFPWIVRACRGAAPSADLSMERWHLADGDRDAEHMSA